MLRGKVVSVLGYGNQGSAQAQNMRDSGVRVVVGNVRDAYFDKAVADGFDTYDIAEAVKRADYHLLLITDEIMPRVFDQDIAPHLKPGQAIVVSSGYNVTYDFLRYPATVDVLLIAPRTIGSAVRKNYLSGRGFASLIGVHHDASGQAKAVMLALAKAIGTLKGCAVDRAATRKPSAICSTSRAGGCTRFRRTAEILVEAGISPEAAILEFWASGELSDVAEVMQSYGLFGQVKHHSQTSQYGQQVTGRLSEAEEDAERSRLRRMLARIQDGTFAKEWTLEQQAGYPTLKRVFQQNMELTR